MFENTAILSLPFSCCQVFSRSVRTDQVRVFRGLGMKRNMIVQFHFSLSNVSVYSIIPPPKNGISSSLQLENFCYSYCYSSPAPECLHEFPLHRFRYTKLSNSLNERLLIVYYFAVTFLGNALFFSKDTFVIPLTIFKRRKIWTQVPHAR